MPQLTEEHFHLIDSNKHKEHERLKKIEQEVRANSVLNTKTQDCLIALKKYKSTSDIKNIISEFFSKE